MLFIEEITKWDGGIMMDKLICLIVSTFVMVGAQATLFIQLSEFRYDRRTVKILTILISAALCAVCIAASIPNDCDRDAVRSLLTLALPGGVCFFIVSKYHGARFFTTYGVAVVSISLVDLFVYLFGLIAYSGDYTIDWIVRATAIVAWSVTLRLLLGDRYRKALNLLQKGWGLMLLCVVAMYIIMCMISAYPTPIDQRLDDVPLSMLTAATMLLTMIIAIRIIYNTLDVKEQQLREHALKSRLSMAESQYSLIMENINEVRRLRHDMKYHMSVIHGFLENQRYDELQQYLNSYQSELTALDTELPLYTQNQTVNILAGYYARRAKAEGIRTEFTIQLPVELPISRTHLTVLLGNLWQNALEACEELTGDTDRYIRTSIAVRQNKFMLQCVNSAVHVRQDEHGQYVSTKGLGHGSGLTSVEDIVGLYSGFCEFGFDRHEFFCSAVLPLPLGGGGDHNVANRDL